MRPLRDCARMSASILICQICSCYPCRYVLVHQRLDQREHGDDHGLVPVTKTIATDPVPYSLLTGSVAPATGKRGIHPAAMPSLTSVLSNLCGLF